MKKRWVIFWWWLLIITALVAGTLLGLPRLIQTINGGHLFSTSTMVSLYVAVYTLEATLLIAILIYTLQNNAAKLDSKRREENAKRIIYTELSTGLKSIVLTPQSTSEVAISSQLSRLFLAYLPDMQQCLTSEQLHHLIATIDFLVNIAHLSVEDPSEATTYVSSKLSLIVQPQFCAAMTSPFADRFSSLSDYRCVLNETTRGILCAISDEDMPTIAKTQLYTTDGKKLADVLEDGRTKIYDTAGLLLCDAILDNNSADFRGIDSGWAKLPDYEGNFLHGVRHGEGCSYTPFGHHKIFEGTWNDGEPTNGTQFDVVMKKRPGSVDDYDFLFPYWREYSLIESHIMDYLYREDDEIDIDRLFVCDINGNMCDERLEPIHIQPLLDFIEKNDPPRLSRVSQILLDYRNNQRVLEDLYST